MRTSYCLLAPIVLLAACERPLPPAVTTARTLEVPHTRSSISIDGRLDEPDWSRAAQTGALIDTMTGRQGDERNAQGRVRVLWSEQALYVAFEIRDEHLVDLAGSEIDPHLWEQDCAEIMLDPHSNGHDYFEMQVSPGRHVFDTHYVTPRQPRPFGDLAWDSHLITAVQARGTINNPRDDDDGYTTEIAIPWTSVAMTAPHGGDTVRANFYLMDRRKNGEQAFAGWSAPMVGDFHVPERFGRMTFRN